MEQVSQGRGDHVDHGREGCDVAIVQRCRMRAVGLDGGEGLADRIEDRIWIEDFAGVAQEVGDAPPGS